ncbi:MAG TPA: tRNA epoxyqueuosine(34) reductase QueG [Nitrospiraceae bacterium]|nr:tRNA epoxyqueuosine(34) reductase QueG [Nitrospiraceae bacterium]
MTLTDSIKQEATALGFDAVGISHVPPASCAPLPLLDRLREWLHQGYCGAMEWMGRNPERRADPRRVLAGCRSIISVGMNYYTDRRADEGPAHGRIARYAWGQDYHHVMGPRLDQLAERIRRLAPKAETRWYVDTGPIMEKAWAQQAGLGWIGKHSNLVSTRFGSWLLLGEILTTLELNPDEPAVDLCGSCTLCIRACPTSAIIEPYVVDARRCISYLTIELPRTGEPIADDFSRKLGNRVFGCDDCLEVCPYNVQETPTAESAFQPSSYTLAPDLEECARLTESEFTARFRQSPIRRAKHAGFLRNVTTALRNASAADHHRPRR